MSINRTHPFDAACRATIHAEGGLVYDWTRVTAADGESAERMLYRRSKRYYVTFE